MVCVTGRGTPCLPRRVTSPTGGARSCFPRFRARGISDSWWMDPPDDDCRWN